MAEIIKFPELLHCEGCGMPLESGEGVPCPIDGCDALACQVCADGSLFCAEHIEHEPDYGLS